MPAILIVDDDPKLLKMLRRTLTYENFEVLTANDGLEALTICRSQKPDLIIMDWMMPKMDGLTAIEQIRTEGIFAMVLMLTAKDAIEDRVEGLEIGADDYLVKPFAPTELVARVHALLRRIRPTPENLKVSYSDLVLDAQTHKAFRAEKELTLTLTEFNLLYLLLRNAGLVMERSHILSEVWGYDFNGEDNVLEIYIGYLRKKMETNGGSRLIQTVRGVGYVLREE